MIFKLILSSTTLNQIADMFKDKVHPRAINCRNDNEKMYKDVLVKIWNKYRPDTLKQIKSSPR